MSDQEQTVFEALGGGEKFVRLVDAFYRGVEQDPLLRPMYPEEDMAGARERLTLFLVQYFGGPPHYHMQRGHPRLRMRHFPFTIGEAERDAWLKHMRAAVDEAEITGWPREAMLNYFASTADFLVNRREATPAGG
jgi:hemoglobin